MRPSGLTYWAAPNSDDPALTQLDPGERAAISLGLLKNADLMLIDERKAASVAINKGLKTTGTLGIVDLAARRGFVDLKVALDQLKGTNFRYRQSILDEVLKQHKDE